MGEVSKKKLDLKIKYKNIFKKITRYFIYLIFLVLLIVTIFIAFKIKEKYFLEEDLEKSLKEDIIKQNKNNELIQDSLDNFEENIKLKEDFLNEKIENLENITRLLQEKINNLQNNVSNLENIDPINNEKNLQIVILLYKIQDIVYRGGNFSRYLEYLINLSKNKEFIFENVLKLERYKNQKMQKDLKNIFYNEYLNILVSKKNKNRIKSFLDDNIKIRKISNFNESIDKVSIDISNIKENIKMFNYQEAINIIINNNYSQYFINTLNVLNKKNETIIIINKILDFLYSL